MKDNNMEIQAELGRLCVGQWFLDDFYEFARKEGVAVDLGMCIFVSHCKSKLTFFL
jgi:hypothetical protein